MKKIVEIETLMNKKVSLYKRVNSTEPCATITIDDLLHKISPASQKVIENIREVNKTDKSTAKKLKSLNLPCCTVSGVFEGAHKEDNLVEKSSIICIDIDEKKPDETWDDVRKKVFELPYVFYVAYSVRGDGIYALAAYDQSNDFKGTFESLFLEFGRMGITIDKACSDICRLRFVSFDDSPMEKGWYDEIEVYDKVYTPIQRPITHDTSVISYSTTDVDTIFAIKVISYLINICGYRADTYNDWLLDGFRLATLGNDGKFLFERLSQMSEGYDPRAVENKWKECQLHTQMTKQSLTYYYGVAKNRMGSGWRRKIEDYFDKK